MTDDIATKKETSETLKEERDNFNSRVKELILKSKEVSVTVSELHEVVAPLKEKEKVLDSVASSLQKNLKVLKNDKKKFAKKALSISSDLKKMYKGASFNPEKLFSEIQKLDWIVQTEVLSGKKEDELSRKVIALEKQLRQSEHYMSVKSEIDSLHDKMDNLRYVSEMHADVISDILDKKFKLQSEMFKTMRKLKKEHLTMRKLNKEINETKRKANIAHEKLVVLIKGERKEKAERDQKRNKEKQERQKKMIEQKKEAKVEEARAIDASYDGLLEQLKKKGKITL